MLEEEAVVSYSQYLSHVGSGQTENIPAPEIAKKIWNLPKDAKLREVVLAIRADEMKHREVNHCIADKLSGQNCDLQLARDIPAKDKKLQQYQYRLISRLVSHFAKGYFDYR